MTCLLAAASFIYEFWVHFPSCWDVCFHYFGVVRFATLLYFSAISKSWQQWTHHVRGPLEYAHEALCTRSDTPWPQMAPRPLRDKPCQSRLSEALYRPKGRGGGGGAHSVFPSACEFEEHRRLGWKEFSISTLTSAGSYAAFSML